MPSAFGRAFLRDRMARAETITELSRVWGNMAVAYQHDEELWAFKEIMKAKLLGQSNERSAFKASATGD